MKQKEVVELDKELGVGAVEAPLKPRPKVFKFKKIKFPLKPVDLGNGQKVEFKTVPLGSGGQSHFGVFDTEDPKIAEKLRAVSKARTQHVFEV